MPACRRDQILNPQTNRCVLKSGKIGQQILANQRGIKNYRVAPRTRETNPYYIKTFSKKYDQNNRTLTFTVRYGPYYNRFLSKLVANYKKTIPKSLAGLFNSFDANFVRINKSPWRLLEVLQNGNEIQITLKSIKDGDMKQMYAVIYDNMDKFLDGLAWDGLEGPYQIGKD